MSLKDKNTIRFAIWNINNVKSNIWRLWVNKNEIYLGAKNTLHVLKVSLHHSGIWRIAFVKDLKREDMESDRVIFKWNKPTLVNNWFVSSIGVIVSSINPNIPFKHEQREDKRIIFIPEAKEGRRMLFKIYISQPGITEEMFKKNLRFTDILIGNLTKQNGEKVWLIYMEDDLSLDELKMIKEVMYNTKIDLRWNIEDITYTPRALRFISEDTPTDNTQPTILDISLGKENVQIST